MLQQQSQSGGNAVSSKEVDLAYKALGQFTSIADFNYLNGGPRMDIATGAYSYDTANRLTGLDYTSNAGANQIDTFGWGYDAANNVTSFSTNTGTATYGNDATNQLTSASYTGTNQPANEAYSYDTNGNRTMAGYTTGPDNLLTSDGTFNYQHDADGNQTVRTRISSVYATDHETTFAWDYRNRLTDVEYFDNNGVLTKHVHYVYGVFDHLLATEVDTTGSGSYDTVEHYVLDVSPEIPSAGVPGTALAPPLLQFNGSGAPTIRYLEALNRIFAEGDISSPTQGDVADFMLTDNLGTVRYVVDQSGTVIDQIDYNSFGQVSYESNPAIHHFAGYTGGHLSAATGLVDADERWLNPATGDWLSQDPSGFAGGDVNLSRYVGNGPTTSTDPTGLFVIHQLFSMQGGMLTFTWHVVGDNGQLTTKSYNVPILSQAYMAPQLMSVAFHPSDPDVPVPPAQTTYVSLTVAMLDPNYTAKLTEAQHDITMLANTAVQFYATVPIIAGVMPTIARAQAQIADYQAVIVELEAEEEAAIQAGKTGLANYYELLIAMTQGTIQQLQAWIAFLTP